MAMPGIEKGQVVWAKLGEYLWWPGIVPSNQIDSLHPATEPSTQVTVQFIGECAQSPQSATFSPTQVLNFVEHLLHHSQTQNTHLLRCIERAKQFDAGDLRISDLPSVNLSLQRLRLGPAQCKQAESESKVLCKPVNPHCEDKFLGGKDCDARQEVQAKPISDQIALTQRTLAAFTRGTEMSDSEISTLLLPFLQVDLPSPLIPRFYRHLKAFLASLPASRKSTARLVRRTLLTFKHRQLTHTLEELVKLPSAPTAPAAVPLPLPVPPIYTAQLRPEELVVPCPTADPVPTLKDDDSTCSVELSLPEDLSEASDSVTFPESEEFVADKDKRRHVCLTIYRILQSNGFNVKDAKSLALKIEGRLRRQDPGMTAGYAMQYKKMVKDIQRLQPEVLIGS